MTGKKSAPTARRSTHTRTACTPTRRSRRAAFSTNRSPETRETAQSLNADRRDVVIAGAGIAGLTAAIAFARRGFPVRVLERAAKLEEVGAGLQLSPNATRLLDRLGVLEHVRAAAVEPDAVVLRDGRTLSALARLPFGAKATARWGAPYLALHRADLHGALLGVARDTPGVRIERDTSVTGAAFDDARIRVAALAGSREAHFEASLLVGADGVHSNVRVAVTPGSPSRFGGEIAWRAMVATDSNAGRALAAITGDTSVTAFLRPAFHLIVYPVRNGASYNLAAFTRVEQARVHSSADASDADRFDVAPLEAGLSRCAPSLRPLADLAWTAWPMRLVDPEEPWTLPEGVALIGDAAHAMTPYAAQGAAMAIEDAVTLADAVAGAQDIPAVLKKWESVRRARVRKVIRRAALNRLAWHAGGPVALARNLFLRLRGEERLVSDLDWLYGSNQ